MDTKHLYSYEYPRAALTVDALLFCVNAGEVSILLIQRGFPPFEKAWALPGGFMEMDETLEEAVQREFFEETGIDGLIWQQLHAFSACDRDPRHRTISVAFWSVCDRKFPLFPASDASQAAWFPLGSLPKLAFDHESIVQMAVKRGVLNDFKKS